MIKRIHIADCLDLVTDTSDEVSDHHLEIQMPDGACCVIILYKDGRDVSNAVIDQWVKRQTELKLAELTTAAIEKVTKS